MSRELFNRNPDLARLRTEGYFVQIQGGFLVMREVPYVDSNRHVRTGTLVSSLDLAGDTTIKPQTHVIHWDGEFPCQADGTPLQGIAHQSQAMDLGHGVSAKHSFSSRPPDGYFDYYAKMSTYATMLGAQRQS
ncbi:DUF6791 domain-containing protein [Cupriavidus basilensis]